MGKRLHSAIKYEVKYGDRSNFNWGMGYINQVIDILAEYDCGYDGEELEFADTLSADRAKLLENIDKIINPCDEWEYQEELNHILESMENDCDEDLRFPREYVYQHLKLIIEQSDSNNAYVHFAWF